MKAIHNTFSLNTPHVPLCSIRQRYKMKAIHNNNHFTNIAIGTVFNTSKIQNESNSQLIIEVCLKMKHCVQYVKDTK